MLLSIWQLNNIEKRIVEEISLVRVKISEEDAIKILGYNPGENPWRLHAYIRIRTDKDYYPRHGIYGIPDEEKSRFAKHFSYIMETGAKKWKEKQRQIEREKAEQEWQIQLKKINAEIEMNRLANLQKARDDARIYAQKRRQQQAADKFFIMAGAAELIKNLAEKQNK